jgi:hypothetical protein
MGISGWPMESHFGTMDHHERPVYVNSGGNGWVCGRIAPDGIALRKAN